MSTEHTAAGSFVNIVLRMVEMRVGERKRGQSGKPYDAVGRQ